MDEPILKHMDVTDQIIKSFYKVYGTLGYGFLESVYRKAMVLELTAAGLKVVPQAPIDVYYAGVKVVVYYADLLVADAVIVELKALAALTSGHEAQLLNYLKATPYEVGLLMNYGPKPTFKRKVYDNWQKGSLCWTRPE